MKEKYLLKDTGEKWILKKNYKEAKCESERVIAEIDRETKYVEKTLGKIWKMTELLNIIRLKAYDLRL